VFLGIDPGCRGAIVILNRNGEVRRTEKMPAQKIKHRTVYDHAAISDLAEGLFWGVEFALLEEQQAFPGQGVVSMFTTGYGYGIWRQVLSLYDVRHETVKPKDWQYEFGIIRRRGNTKAQALQRAEALWPDVDLKAHRTKAGKLVGNDGLADALLIAEYARRKHLGGLTQHRKR